MKELSSITKSLLNDVYDTISILHSHWADSGAIRNEKEEYLIKINESTHLMYVPYASKIGIAFAGRVKDFKHIMSYSKDTGYVFNDHMDEKALDHFTSVVSDINAELLTIKEKAMNYSPSFMLKAKEMEMIKVATEILHGLAKKQSLLGLQDLNKSEKGDSQEFEIFNRLSGPKFYVSLNSEDRLLQFSKSSPNGEKEQLLYVMESRNKGFPAFLGFNQDLHIEDKVVVLKACLLEAAAFNSLLKHEIEGLEKVVQLREKGYENEAPIR